MTLRSTQPLVKMSTRNIPGGKGGRCVRVMTSPPLSAECHENLGAYTGLFISPSGISDPCGTVAGMVTPKGSISTEGKTLQVSVLPYRCSICAPLLTSEGSWQTFLAHARQSRPMAPVGLFVSQRTVNHSAGISCTTHELFCPKVVLCGTWSETSVAPSQ